MRLYCGTQRFLLVAMHFRGLRVKSSPHVTFFLFQFIKFLMDKSVIVQLWGKQIVDKKPVNKTAKKGKDTKAIMRAETLKKNVSIR